MTNPQLPSLLGGEPDTDFQARTEARWHHYPIRVYPQHTDHAGIAWHGSYIGWMEAARIECLRAEGIDYDNLVALGCDLPVVELALRYHRALRLGQQALLKTRFAGLKGARLLLEQCFCSPEDDDSALYASGRVTLVALDRARGKIMRRLPPELQAALVKLDG